MKSVQINSVYGVGSTGTIAKDICAYMTKKGIESKVFFGYGSFADNNAASFSSKISVKLHVLQTRLLGKHAFYSKMPTRRLIKMLKAYQPDVIHIHQIHGHYLNIPILFNFLEKSNAKIIFTLHDCWMFTGHCAHFYHVNCNKWITGCGNCPQLTSYPKSLIFDRSKASWRDKKKYFTKLQKATLVTPSNWLFNYLQKSFLSNFDRCVINNGIDINVFNPKNIDVLRKKLMLENKFIIIGMADKWLYKENAQQSIDLINALDNDTRVLLFGVKPKQASILPKKTICIPYVNDRDSLAMHYSLGDVFINLSLEDTFPTVNLEALACGLPIIAFNSGGSAEVIDEKTGIVVETGDFDGIKKAIASIKESKKNYKENCRKKAEILYDKELSYEKYYQLYIK